MASKYVDEWLSKGLSLPKFLLRAIGAAGVVVTAISLVKYFRGVPYGVDIAVGLLFVTIWALSETFRVKTIHKRYVAAHPEEQSILRLSRFALIERQGIPAMSRWASEPL